MSCGSGTPAPAGNRSRRPPRDEFNLSLYIYDKAFQFPPGYGLGGALALIFTLILLVVTVGYVRASVRQGALT